MKVSSLITVAAAAALLAACGQRDEPTRAAAPADAVDTAAAPVDPSSPAGVIKARQDNLERMGEALKAMADESKKREPQLAVFQTNVRTVSELAPQLHSWFPAGTGPEAGVETEALPVIWTRPDEFKQRADAFAAEAQKFEATVQSGDIDAIRAGIPSLGRTCGGCHDTFRVDD